MRAHARGDDAATEALAEAVRRYAAAKGLVDPGCEYENVVHFFGADGVGFEKVRKPALQRLEASQAELMKWSTRLGAIAMRLESEAIAARRG